MEKIKFLTQAEWDESPIKRKIRETQDQIIDLITIEEESGRGCHMLWKELGFLQGMQATLALSDELILKCLNNLETKYKKDKENYE